MATLTPEVDIASALATALTLVVGTDIKYGPPRAPLSTGNAATIWVTPYGGSEPDPLLNASVSGSIWHSKIQVLVRSGADDYTDGITQARAVRDALHCKQSSGYIAWRALSSEPLYLGIDEVQEHRWAVNILAEWNA